MHISLTSKHVSTCLNYVLKVFYRINVPCLTKLKYTNKGTEFVISFDQKEKKKLLLETYVVSRLLNTYRRAFYDGPTCKI